MPNKWLAEKMIHKNEDIKEGRTTAIDLHT